MTVPAESEADCLGCMMTSRRAAMRSATDPRAAPLVADISGAEDLGVAKFSMLGLWACMLLPGLPIEPETP